MDPSESSANTLQSHGAELCHHLTPSPTLESPVPPASFVTRQYMCVNGVCVAGCYCVLKLFIKLSVQFLSVHLFHASVQILGDRPLTHFTWLLVMQNSGAVSLLFDQCCLVFGCLCAWCNHSDERRELWDCSGKRQNPTSPLPRLMVASSREKLDMTSKSIEGYLKIQDPSSSGQ